MRYESLYIFAVLIELVGIVLVTGGLVYEYMAKADLGYVIITAGSVLIAAGSMIFAKVAPWLRGEV